jgi:hypothetical protein
MRTMESASVRLSLKAGISPTQARFALANFCLDQLGTEGQALATVIELCKDLASLQQALDDIQIEVDGSCPDRLPALAACVNEINETAF